MTYYAIRTERDKDADVAKAIQALGYPVHMLTVVHVIKGHRKAPPRKIERPMLPGWLFAGLPVSVHGKLWEIDGYLATERDSASTAIPVPSEQIKECLSELDAHNARMLRWFRLLQAGDKRPGRVPVMKCRALSELGRLLDEAVNMGGE